MSSAGELTYKRVTEDVSSIGERAGKIWLAIFVADLLVLAFGVACFVHQVRTGLGVTGYTRPAMWSIYITDFVFWVGIAHSGTLISAILFLFRAQFRTAVYRISETMTVFAVMTANTVMASAAR